MKERRSKRIRKADGKKNEKETTNDEEDSSCEQESSPSESKDSNNEGKVQRKVPKKAQRHSKRKIIRKSFCELSDKEDDDTEESRESSENISPKRGSLRRSAGSAKLKNSSAHGDEMNGEKVQTKKDTRANTITTENETEAENADVENVNKNELEPMDEESEKSAKLAKKGSKRKIPSRGLEAKRSKDDDSEKNGESDVSLEEAENVAKSKKNETKKPRGKSSNAKEKEEDDDDDERSLEEYEVEKLIDIYFKKNGEREFLVRWKGYSSKDDTWEPEKHLNCKELIDAFLEKCEKAKSIPLREMRRIRRTTDRYVINEGIRGRKLSARLKHKPRKTYFDVE